MATTTVGVGWMEVLLILLGGSGLIGTPPGDRDGALLKAAPQQSLIYVEWASRGAGKSGAPGIDGIAADPEVLALIEAIDKAIAPAAPLPDEVPEQNTNRDALRLARLVTNHSGCVFAIANPPQPQKGLFSVVNPADAMSQLHVCVIVNAGTDAGAIIEAFKQVVQSDIPAQPKMHEIPGPKGMPLTIHQEGERLLLGLGKGTVDRALAGLRGEVPGLESNPRFAAGWKRVAIGRTGSVAWFDLKGSSNAAIQALGPAGLLAQTVLRGAGADALDFAISGTGVVDGNVIERTFIETGGKTDGVLLVAKNPALKREQLSHIPVDSDVVMAGSLDLPTLVIGVRDLIAKTNPLSVKVFDEATRELETELGLNLAKDVYPAFGNAWTAFSSPSESGLMGTGMIFALEVRDTAKAQVVFDRLMQLLEQSLTAEGNEDYGQTELRRQEFLGHAIHYVHHANTIHWATASTTPSFCLSRGHLLFALHPQAMKSHLRYLAHPRPGFDTVAGSKLSLPGEELLLTSYFDGMRATQALSGLAPFLGQMMTERAEANGWEFDSFAIPSTAALVPYSGDITLSVARQQDGLLIESKNPHLGAALLAAIGSIRSWCHSDYETLLEAKRQRRYSVQNVGLGAAEGQVVPAAAVKPAPDEPKEPVAGAVARRVTPLMLKALVPDVAQQFIPGNVFRGIAEPPSPEVLKQREELRKLIDERRRERLERRRVPVPANP